MNFLHNLNDIIKLLSDLYLAKILDFSNKIVLPVKQLNCVCYTNVLFPQ